MVSSGCSDRMSVYMPYILPDGVSETVSVWGSLQESSLTVCICICKHIYMHIYTYTCMYKYIYICVCM